MSRANTHRLDGLEPDNLLAWLALLGLLRTLEHARPAWRPRAGWTVDEPPLRPRLQLRTPVTRDELLAVTAGGIGALARLHDFGGAELKLPAGSETRDLLAHGARGPRHTADLWAALGSDAAKSSDGSELEPTPLCLMFGAGHQRFVERLADVPRTPEPPLRGNGRGATTVAEEESLAEALFSPWTRPDATKGFRWEPAEDVRHALRARDPTDPATRETTQHGANRLAAIGLSVLTVVPQRHGTDVRLGLVGGARTRTGEWRYAWPIWREPVTLAAVRAMLVHPRVHEPAVRATLGIVEVRTARQIRSERYRNVTRAAAARRAGAPVHPPSPESARMA